ncbi:hypothetical protein F8M41_022338 [Gigaspora margarita]|uniref:CCHC-type domain-containing protein n=1 Tax=Gigaspora margarita TaxID=4874 RepID=A0A8H4EI21_GIGMA|nr:hypothetical protein F8M41_022338 [Gigaspora margarita]
MRVLAIVRTKLKGIALEIFDSEIGTINCYWRSNINRNVNLIATLKDTTEYPTNLNHLYTGAFDVTATTEGERCNPHITNAIVQKGFREVFDNAFLVDAIQQTAQKDFWSFDFTKGLDYSNDNRMRNLINKYKKLMQIANWQWGNNFYGGEYMFLLQRMPPAIMKHISSMHPKLANRNDFFTAADNQFLAVRLTISLTGNLKEKVSHFKERKSTKFNNLQTSESNNTFLCHFCKQPGHYKRNCLKLRGQQNFNRVIVSYTRDPSNPKKMIPVYRNKYCIKCEKEKPWYTPKCPKNNNATHYMGKRGFKNNPMPMVIGNTRNNRFPKGNNYKRNNNQKENYRKGNNNNYRKNNNNNNRRRYNNVKSSNQEDNSEEKKRNNYQNQNSNNQNNKPYQNRNLRCTQEQNPNNGRRLKQSLSTKEYCYNIKTVKQEKLNINEIKCINNQILNKEPNINIYYDKYSAKEILSNELYPKALQDPDYKYLLKTYHFPKQLQWLIPNEKGKKAYEFIGLMNRKPIKILLDEEANSSVMTYNVAKEWNLLHLIPKKAELSAITPGGISIANYEKIPVTFQLENYLMIIKVAVIEGEQSYILMS